MSRQIARVAVVLLVLVLMTVVVGAQAAPTSTPPTPSSQQNPSSRAPAPKLLSVVTIATSTGGTSTHTIATALSKVANENTPITVKVKAYTGPTAYAQLVEQGEENLGLMNVVDAWMAYRGIDTYKEALPNLRLVAGGVHPFLVGIFVRKSSSIKDIKDLRGKRFPVGYGGQAAMQRQTLATVEAAGLTMNDVVSVPVASYAEAVRAFMDDRVDVVLSSVGSGSEKEADAAVGVRYINYAAGPNAQKTLDKYIPGFVAIKCPKGKSSAAAEGTIVWGYPQHLVGSTKLDDYTVQTLLKAWWDKVDQLRLIHLIMEGWTRETMAINLFNLPYHSGSIKFFKDKGVWTEELEAKQQTLLRK